MLQGRGVVEGVLRGVEPPLLKFPFNLGGLSPPLKILIQTEIICDNMLNFSQFVRIWHYFTLEIQLFQFTSVPFLKVKPVQWTGAQANKPCGDCTLSSYDKAMRCWKLCF